MACSMIWTSSSKGISRSLSMSRSTLRSMSTEGLHYSGLNAGELLSHSRTSKVPESNWGRVPPLVEGEVLRDEFADRGRRLHAGATVPQFDHPVGCPLADDNDDRNSEQLGITELDSWRDLAPVVQKHIRPGLLEVGDELLCRLVDDLFLRRRDDVHVERADVARPDQAAIVIIGLSDDRHGAGDRSEEHTSELQSRPHLVCR